MMKDFRKLRRKKVCKNPDISHTVSHDKRWRCKDVDKSYLRGIQHVPGETIPSNQKICLILVCEEKDIYKGIHWNQNRNPKNKQDLMMRLLHITYRMLPQFKYIRMHYIRSYDRLSIICINTVPGALLMDQGHEELGVLQTKFPSPEICYLKQKATDDKTRVHETREHRSEGLASGRSALAAQLLFYI